MFFWSHENPMTLKARVTTVSGNTTHRAAHIEADTVVADGVFPPPSWVQIVQTDEGFFLLYLDAAGVALTDTWHQTLEEAKRQAEFEFEIQAPDWFDDGK